MRIIKKVILTVLTVIGVVFLMGNGDALAAEGDTATATMKFNDIAGTAGWNGSQNSLSIKGYLQCDGVQEKRAGLYYRLREFFANESDVNEYLVWNLKSCKTPNDGIVLSRNGTALMRISVTDNTAKVESLNGEVSPITTSELQNALNGTLQGTGGFMTQIGTVEEYPNFNEALQNSTLASEMLREMEDALAMTGDMVYNNMNLDLSAHDGEATEEDEREVVAVLQPSREEIEQNGGSNGVSCQAGGAAGSLGWIICPILDKVAEGLDWLYTEAVEPFLVTNPELVNNNSGTRSAWNVVVGFANVLMVIFLLVVIFSQLTGLGIDNYGIKRSLPKLIMAAVLVNLSFIICQLMVDLSNIIGNGLNDMLRNIPVNVPAIALSDGTTLIANEASNALWFKVVFTAVGGGLVAVGGVSLAMSVLSAGWFSAVILPILLFLLVALVAVLFFFILLGVRKAAVVILVVLSPLAFVAYVLPNTKKWFDKWKNAFQGMLLLYPICGLLIGGGQLVSKILLSVSDDYIMYLTGAIVMVVPFFFIPVLLRDSFKAVGNIGARIAGIGQNIGKRGRTQLDNTIRGSNRFKASQAEFARRAQERNANNTIRRLQTKQKRNGGTLNTADQRLMARSQETLKKMQREDVAAATAMTEQEFVENTEPELQAAWRTAFDSGNLERLEAITNVMNSRYGSGAANFFGQELATRDVAHNVNMQRSMRTLRDNMNNNSSFATNMKNKASDAYAMISSAGMVYNTGTGENEFKNLSHFSSNNKVSTDLKDWSTQSGATLQRAIDSGALSNEMVEQLLTSDDPSIRSGIQSDASKRNVLQAQLYRANNTTTVGPMPSNEIAANLYREQQRQRQQDNELYISHERDAERIGKTTITVTPGSTITGTPPVTFDGYAVPAGFNAGGAAPVRDPQSGHYIYTDATNGRRWDATTGRYVQQ